ncbi:hypothetical protein [Thermoflexus sp.]|uniref:hypothetical protein n=1 Tax=Thermoflexus sp. TaxID=1969742 RepID=UPI002ADD8022|nr:hypothetical protein [Thermoflexus sp.]
MVGIIVPVGENTCGVVIVVVECDGRITDRDPVYHSVGRCPVGAEHFRKYCDPASAFSASDGFCELVDYYGNRIRLRVTAPRTSSRPGPIRWASSPARTSSASSIPPSASGGSRPPSGTPTGTTPPTPTRAGAYGCGEEIGGRAIRRITRSRAISVRRS